jgi:5-formyltetrahydrofolate cyclo-ligase
MEKKDIRKEVFARRKALKDQDRLEKSEIICEKIMSTSLWKDAACIYAYMDCKGEVCMRPLLEAAWKEGKRVAVPKVFGTEMRFFYIHSYEDVEPGYYSIPEPTGGEEADCPDALMIMPGVAFDDKRHRCGYGGGFYDRFLEAHPALLTIAPAFDFQIMEQVPAEIFDRLPQMVVTETRTFEK